jgi:hypothetical protein
MTTFELEDALVEFISGETDELRFLSNETTPERVAPNVWSGFIPRDEVGAILPGDITTYPAVIVSAQSGAQTDWDCELVTVSVFIGCYDADLDQQGYRDCCNLVQLLKDRFREEDIIRERFPIRMPLKWQMHARPPGAGNGFPYYFSELLLTFELPAAVSQYDVTFADGDVSPGRYNSKPIPTPEPNEHWRPVGPPPAIKFEEVYELPKGPGD